MEPLGITAPMAAVGFGVGLLVGLTGVGGGSPMTPLLILVFGTQATTAVLVGGTGALVTALTARLPASNIQLDARVTHVALRGEEIKVTFAKTTGAEETVKSAYVLFTLPPRLLEATVTFAPALDEKTSRRWRDTPTWMAPHAKFFALYDRPFWRDAGLCGAAQSMIGPLKLTILVTDGFP